MQIYDISMLIEEDMPTYKNMQDKKPRISVIKDFTSGNIYESHIEMDMHTGTHIDSPMHMLPWGHSIDKTDISKLVTECAVLDLTHVEEKITADDLRKKDIKADSFVLLKTGNSFSGLFDPAFIYLASSGAEYLAKMKISGVGIDSLGIERSQPDHHTHKVLFEHGIIILEGLVLSKVEEGSYQLIALPLKIRGTEAAPARVILLK